MSLKLYQDILNINTQNGADGWSFRFMIGLNTDPASDSWAQGLRFESSELRYP